ncbi:MAG: NAD-dependent epimerase/dehydratase family protein [Pirellulales bacterium]|nr:NAD-dependent epimerase/dehydratase family protein [Pirellulales bacterium]
MTAQLAGLIERLQGPVLVLGASGFIGANLLKKLSAHRSDVLGTASSFPAWRLEGIPELHVCVVDLLVESNLDRLLEQFRPRTVFNCVAYGGYSFQSDRELIYKTNFNLTATLLGRLESRKIAVYVHAGSSSEYGDQAGGSPEDSLPSPNSDYAVSKVATANLLHYYGRTRRFPCVNLRLYSVYGPMEDSSRLVPAVVREGLEKRFPPFVHPEISRDFVYIDDACEAFVRAAVCLREEHYGESFNIGTGCKTTIADIARLAKRLFQIEGEPVFSMPNRAWDVAEWYADNRKTVRELGWHPQTDIEEGLRRTAAWYDRIEDKERYYHSSKQFGLDTKHSVTAVVACYKDGQAIPIMYRRLKDIFEKLKIEYEIIFVNDNSPDDSEEIIRAITRNDRRVLGISHSRNFGSQAAFRSGMELATKNSCVLLDGDLQDPPELIEQFVEKWRQDYDVVYGRRIKRVAPFWMQVSYKLFYRIFDFFSYLEIPHDAGDFSLIDRRVVQCMLRFPERDLFLRGVRAFAGFRQTGVDYIRPERMFGRTTNSLAKNIAWAKKGILSFSNTLLTMLSFLGTALFLLTVLLMTVQASLRLMYPELAPRGITTVVLAVMFFGSVNLLGIGVLAEYIAKVFEEVKQRPVFIRRSIIKDGEIRRTSDKV